MTPARPPQGGRALPFLEPVLTTPSWDDYARLTPAGRIGPPPPFSWTPVPGHGPGLELLDIPPRSAALELGCGKGDRLAHLAALGIRAVGVDLSAVQVAAATARWGPAIEVHQADAVHFLHRTADVFDTVLSVFGAHWFTDPEVLLPAVRPRLREGGILALAHVPPGPEADPSERVSATGRGTVLRWEGQSGGWAGVLLRHGFERPAVTAIEPPYGSGGVRTVVLTAHG